MTCPDLTPCAQAALWLADAKAALHAMLTGTKVIALQHADKSLRYDAANIDALRSYVRILQDQVDACNGVRSRGRAIAFIPTGW